MHTDAEKILQSMENDVELVRPNLADWWLHYLHTHYNYYMTTLSLLDKDDMGRRILEIGSVPGQFTILLKRLGYRVQGVDIEPARVERLWSKYNIKVDKVDVECEPLPFSSDSFNLILFTEILEHLRLNPLYALREIYRVLKDGGRIILSIPNITPMHRLLFLFAKSYQGNPLEEFRKLERLGHMGHMRLYSFGEVKELLEYVGSKLDSYAYRGSVPGGFKTRIIMLLYPKKEHLKRLLCIVAEKDG